MSKALVIAEHDGQTLSQATARTVACALRLGIERLDLALFSPPGNENMANTAARLEGVDRVLLVEHDDFTHPLACVLVPAILSLAQGYSHFLAPHTTFGKDLMPRFAALMNVPQVSDVMEVVSSSTFVRPIYAGNAIVTVEAPGEPVVLTVRTASFAPAPNTGAAIIERFEASVQKVGHTSFIELLGESRERPDLQSARVVVAGGRGVGSSAGFQALYALADRLEAAVGATRAAVDAGYAPNDSQIGQTGKIIAPELYLAIGISGAIQHTAGVKDAGTIVAVNHDPDAPIFEIADYGLVADAQTAIPELIAAFFSQS